jgi:uncharacterized protein YehS (DUF1456 family)
MNNNYVFRYLNDILGDDTAGMVKIFDSADTQVSEDLVLAWGATKYDENFKKMPDPQMAVFLNGLINHLRGKKDGPQPTPERRLNNNLILMKLKIAFNLKADDLMAVFELAGVEINKHDLNALFRKPENKHYRSCKDETLTSFLEGISIRQKNLEA